MKAIGANGRRPRTPRCERAVLAVVIAGLCACDGRPANKPQSVDTGSAARGGTAEAAPPQNRLSGELAKPLENYSPQEFWNEFNPGSNSTNTEFTNESDVLLRWCDNFNKACGFRARALQRSISIELNALPPSGVVMGVYRFAASFVSEEVVYRMKDRWTYFLVIKPAATPSATEARWRLMGVRQGGSGERHLIPENGWGVYTACDNAGGHTSAEAGFESCEKRQQIARRADSLGVSFHEALEEERARVIDDGINNWLRTVAPSRAKLTAYTGGPLDFAWTTCAAGCCQATF